MNRHTRRWFIAALLASPAAAQLPWIKEVQGMEVMTGKIKYTAGQMLYFLHDGKGEWKVSFDDRWKWRDTGAPAIRK